MRGNLVNLNIKAFNKQRSGLIVKCLKIPHYAYSSRWSAILQSWSWLSASSKHMLSEFTPDIEIYSIEEAFLLLAGFEKHFDLGAYGKEMILTVKSRTGIPTSVGIAPTKALAKVANKIAEKFSTRTGGVYVLDNPEKTRKALLWKKIGDVWGISRQYEKRLLALNIRNAQQFVELHDDYVRKEFSVVGLRLKRDLSGLTTLSLEATSKKKNIAVTRAFENML